MHHKDVDIFVLPPPRTPVSSKKNARHNKNVLTTPNQNANVNGTKTNAGTPKGKSRLLYSTNGNNEVQKMQGFSPSHSLFVYCN